MKAAELMSMVEIFWGWRKLSTGKENEIRYHKDQMLIY